MTFIVWFLFFITFPSYLFSQNKGDLDLPDVFIWGEDRSALPGIGDEDIFLSPYLRKFNFLGPLDLDYPEKINKGYIYPGGTGLRISSGLGSYEEYSLSASQSGFVPKGWFYDYHLGGTKESLQGQEFHYTDFNGWLHLGKNHGSWCWGLGGKGAQRDSSLKRNILKAEAEISGDIAGISLGSRGWVNSIYIDSRDGSEYEAEFNVRFPVVHNHWLGISYKNGFLEMGSNKKERDQINFSYFNTAYQDFSFLAEAGYRDSQHLTWRGKIGGEFLGTGFGLYLEKQYYDRDMFLLYSGYPFLNLDSGYSPESVSAGGFRIMRKFFGTAEAHINLRLSRVRNRLVLIGRPDDMVPLNMDESVDILEFSGEYSHGWFGADFILRDSDQDMPYFYNQGSVSLSGDIIRVNSEPINLMTSMGYIAEHELFLDKSGKNREKIDSYLTWNMELKYSISRFVALRLGGENLLADRISPPGGYADDRRKLYIILSFGYLHKKNSTKDN